MMPYLCWIVRPILTITVFTGTIILVTVSFTMTFVATILTIIHRTLLRNLRALILALYLIPLHKMDSALYYIVDCPLYALS